MGFWRPHQRLDVRVWSHLAVTYLGKTSLDSHLQNEAEKRRIYAERIMEMENGVFTPFVMSTSGGTAPAAEACLNVIAQSMEKKMGIRYCQAMTYLRDENQGNY